MQIVAIADSGAALRIVLEKTKADVLLMDISLPDINGIDMCAEVKSKFTDIKVIALSNHNERSFIIRMLKNNASGYLVKSSSINEIESVVLEVYNGGIYFGAEAKKILASLANDAAEEIPPITKREMEVLQLIAIGQTSSQIAEQLFISAQTMDSHRKSLMAKFSVNKSLNLIQKGKELGVL